MEKLKINQVAQELGVTPAGVYKRLKTDPQLVENHVIKEKKTTYITREGVEILREAMQKALPVSNSTGSQPVESMTIKHLQEVIANQQRTIDNLITRQAEERGRTDTIIMKLSNDLGSMRNLLKEAKKPIPLLVEPPKPVSVWKPERVKDPLEDLTWYQRAWVQVFEPWKMRKYAS